LYCKLIRIKGESSDFPMSAAHHRSGCAKCCAASTEEFLLTVVWRDHITLSGRVAPNLHLKGDLEL
jgi:hypothetical protein